MKERYTEDEFNRALDYLAETIKQRDQALRIMREMAVRLAALGAEVREFRAAEQELAADIEAAKARQRARAEAAISKQKPPPARFT